MINDALRTLTGSVRLLPADNFPILAGIQPAELRRTGATLSLGRRAMEPEHLLHSTLTRPSSADARRLKSRHPIVPATQQLISFSDNNIRAAQWADHQWDAEWADNPTRLRIFIPDTGTHPPGMTLPRNAWVRLNRLRTGVGRFRSCLRKWGMILSASFWCALEQGFSNCGSPHLGSRSVILRSWNKLTWQTSYKRFCKLYKKIESRPAVNLSLLHFRGNTAFHAVSCLLGCQLAWAVKW